MEFRISQNHEKRIYSNFRVLFTLIYALLFSTCLLPGQSDTNKTNLSFNGDFRFRIEQDWNSLKSDGTLRNDRSRLRYRFRAGATYKKTWSEVGFRMRTGNPRKQQDPQLTLGEGLKEFGTLPVGLEKAYFKGKFNSTNFWFGKNAFSFEKNNELFWSDNVYPEGIFIEKGFSLGINSGDSISLKASHFILNASGESFQKDSYYQGLQAYAELFESKLILFPSFYYFNAVPNIPDGGGTFAINYSIVHLGSRINLSRKPYTAFEFDLYKNVQDLSSNDSIHSIFQGQSNGFNLGIKFGELKEKGDFHFALTYAKIEQFSILDIMAQNDWARWDYSSYGSPDGRLSNFQGFECVLAYALEDNIKLVMKYYKVEQLISYDLQKETGNRIRLDLDIKF